MVPLMASDAAAGVAWRGSLQQGMGGGRSLSCFAVVNCARSEVVARQWELSALLLSWGDVVMARHPATFIPINLDLAITEEEPRRCGGAVYAGKIEARTVAAIAYAERICDADITTTVER